MTDSTKTDKKNDGKNEKSKLRDVFFKCPVCNQNVRAELGISECPVCGAKLEKN